MFNGFLVWCYLSAAGACTMQNNVGSFSGPGGYTNELQCEREMLGLVSQAIIPEREKNLNKLATMPTLRATLICRGSRL